MELLLPSAYMIGLVKMVLGCMRPVLGCGGWEHCKMRPLLLWGYHIVVRVVLIGVKFLCLIGLGLVAMVLNFFVPCFIWLTMESEPSWEMSFAAIEFLT